MRLRTFNKGFYVDVGAWHPSRDSVTLHFYKEGWRGINVEPNRDMYHKLTMERAEDINLQAVVASSGGSRRLFVIGETGLSTIDPEIVALDRRQGFDVTDEYDVPAVTLQDLLDGHAAGRTVDFLKIDAEGAEGDILLATSFETARPRILVIEAVLPNTQEPTWEAWEPHLLAHGYTFVWFDGLNRFYLRLEDRDRVEYFALPPNVFDNFVTARTDPTPALEDELRASLSQVAALRAENASIRAELSQLKHSPSWRLTRPVRWISSLHLRLNARQQKAGRW